VAKRLCWIVVVLGLLAIGGLLYLGARVSRLENRLRAAEFSVEDAWLKINNLEK
jgi:hypothetical protein